MLNLWIIKGINKNFPILRYVYDIVNVSKKETGQFQPPVFILNGMLYTYLRLLKFLLVVEL